MAARVEEDQAWFGEHAGDAKIAQARARGAKQQGRYALNPLFRLLAKSGRRK